MALTYKIITSGATGAGDTTNINITSIPQTYTDLLLYFSPRSFAGNEGSVVTYLNFNSDASDGNYFYRRLLSSGSTASSGNGNSRQLNILQGANTSANTFGNNFIYIPNYTGSQQKVASVEFVNETAGSEVYMGFYNYRWNNTSAITSMTLTGNGAYGPNTSWTLYGILKA